jgi:TP53 regulating kinase-like protein
MWFNNDIYLIDFGLCSTSSSDEDKAVDLYVLQRALETTQQGTLFAKILLNYRHPKVLDRLSKGK